MKKIIEQLKSKARPNKLEGMAKFGIAGKKRLGVSMPDLRNIAKEIGKDHNLARDLWDTDIQDARILASLIGSVEKVTEELMEKWVKDFDSWDVCDQVCLNLFERVPFVKKKIFDWAVRDEEFVKRSAFSLIAVLAVHDKKAPDVDFIRYTKVIKVGSKDNRNFVKKAVSWALRNIGKRNKDLNTYAIKVAREIQEMEFKSSRWIASDVIRELQSEAVQNKWKND